MKHCLMRFIGYICSRVTGDIEYWRQGSMKTLEDDAMKHDNFPYVGCIGAIK